MNQTEHKFEERYNIIVPNKGKGSFCSKIENRVYDVFERAISELNNKDDFRLLHNLRFKTSSSRLFEIDILLLFKESPLAIIEVKKNLIDFRPELKDIFSHYCKMLNAQYCFVCSGDLFNLYKAADNTLNEIRNGERLSPANIYNFLNDNESDKGLIFENLTDEQIIEHLNEIITDSHVDDKIKQSLKDIISQSVVCSFDNSSYFIDQSLEREFFLTLLGKVPSKICRYTSLASIFRTLNDKEQSMCSIVCMNDRSEIEYASKKIGYETLVNRGDANNCYILSCAHFSKKDNLTMWRLYGDDGEGVNIEYEVDKSLLYSYSSFAIAPISYADKNGLDPNLELVKNLLDANIGGAKFQLNEWSIWQHFFKPYEYRDESEIRLLFWDEPHYNEDEKKEEVPGKNPEFKRKWILESSYGVVAPIVCFKIAPNPSSFPLIIKQIMIGPKNKEKEQNYEQVLQLAKAKGICSPTYKYFTAISAINHYR